MLALAKAGAREPTQEFAQPEERACLMERVMTIDTLDHYRSHPDEFLHWIMYHNEIDRHYFQQSWLWYWSYSDEIRALQISQIFIDALRLAETTHSYQSAKNFVTTNYARLGFAAPRPGDDPLRMDIDELELPTLFSEAVRKSFRRTVRNSLATETTREIVTTAIAIKRYEIHHQHPPATLRELIPDFLKTLPTDWMDGQPLRYRPNPNGTYLLYSVGENGQDDGGNPALAHDDRSASTGFSFLNPYTLDRIWPQPATCEAIQKYNRDHKEPKE